MVDSQGKVDNKGRQIALPTAGENKKWPYLLFLGKPTGLAFLGWKGTECRGKGREGRRRVGGDTHTCTLRQRSWKEIHSDCKRPYLMRGNAPWESRDCYQKTDFSISNAKQKVGVLWVWLEGETRTKERDRPPLTPQEWKLDFCWMFYRCLLASSPSHYSLGEKLSQAHQGKQRCMNQDFVATDHNSYHTEFLRGSTWADLFIYVPCGCLLGLPHCDHYRVSWVYIRVAQAHGGLLNAFITHSLKRRRRNAWKCIWAVSEPSGPESRAGDCDTWAHILVPSIVRYVNLDNSILQLHFSFPNCKIRVVLFRTLIQQVNEVWLWLKYCRND